MSMRIDPIQLEKKSLLINDYEKHEQKIMDFFDYSPIHDYEKRVIDIQNRSFKRKQLTEVLQKVNERWDAPPSTMANINRLKSEDSVVVIGGQQAGLMTGPLYSVNKAISIIQFAKKQEECLGIPVIPVFWIAGEDHDYDEINHVFFIGNENLEKHSLGQQVNEKHSISDINIDRIHANQWLDELFIQLKETKYTKKLYEIVKNCLDQSTTYVDFFARLIFQLFQEEGLVLIDSGSPEIRHLESEYFVQLIEKQADISKTVYDSFHQLTQLGYSISLDVELNDCHLFIYDHGERILLERNEFGEWVGKQNEIKLTTEELLDIAKNTPELLSNNVVSRPLMQELVFPTLAFVGGLGEISYWSVLKSAFHSLEIKMPPVLPRLSFTFIDKNTKKKLRKFAIDGGFAVNHGVDQHKINWLAEQSHPPLHQITDQLKQTINDAHRPLRNLATEIRSDLGQLATKNLEYLHRDIDFLEKRIQKAIEEKYHNELLIFNQINLTLFPNRGLQERVWNPLLLINEHGVDFLKKLTNESCSFKEDHFLVYI